MGYRRLHTLGDAQRHGFLLEITCANASCARQRTVEPLALIKRFGANARPADIGPHMRCKGEDLWGGGCGCKGAVLRFIDPPMAPDDDPDDDPGPGGNVVAMGRKRFTRDEQPMVIRRRRAA